MVFTEPILSKIALVGRGEVGVSRVLAHCRDHMIDDVGAHGVVILRTAVEPMRTSGKPALALV